MRLKLSSGFTISVTENGLESAHELNGVTHVGFIHGKKNLQILKKEIIEILGRRPLNASGVKMRSLADMIEKEIPGLAFVILVAEFGGDHGLTNYISNGDRSDCIKWLRDTADRIERNSSFPTPEHN